MKSRASLHRWSAISSITVLLVALTPGCDQSSRTSAPTPPPAPPPSAPVAVSAEPTSFREVTSRLDPGGSLYVYLSTSQWLDGLSAKVGEFKSLIGSLPELGEPERQQIGRGIALVSELIRQSGLESLSGVGFSGIALEPGFYRSKVVLQRKSGSPDGYLWSLMGTAPHPMDARDWLPESTALASFADLDAGRAWDALKGLLTTAGIAEGKAALDQAEAKLQEISGMSFDEFRGSLAGHFGFVLLLDPTNKVSIPLPNNPGFSLAEPGLVVGIQVRDDRLFEWADRLLSSNPQVIKRDTPDVRMRTLEVPVPIPLSVRPSIARSGDYLWLSTHDRWIEQLVAVKTGKAPGLRATAEYQKLANGLPETGNQFTYASERLGELVTAVQRAAMAAGAQNQGPPPELFEKLFAASGSVASCSIGQVTAEGWFEVGHGYQEPANAIVAPLVAVPVALFAGITIPAFVKARATAQTTMCMNHLKQLGLAALIYADDHNGLLPADLRSVKDQLMTTTVLICPADKGRNAQGNLEWDQVAPDRISYEFVSPGLKLDALESTKALFRCKVHGHVCRADGSVSKETN